jgi:hypothetical protein
MNRSSAALAVIGMLLLAVVLTIWKTLESSEKLGGSATGLLAIQAVIAVALVAASAIVIRRSIPTKQRNLSRGVPSILQPLRRLISVVWS